MKHRSIRRALLMRAPRNQDDGSIAMLMLVIVVSTALGGIMLSMIVNQSRSTHFASSRVQELAAAQAGTDVALGQLRSATMTNATTGVVSGDAGKLPCGSQTTPPGSWSGTVDSKGLARYQSHVDYYFDSTSLTNKQKMLCTSVGPYQASAHSRTPAFAVITSTGTDGSSTGSSAGRTVTSTYVVRTNDVNVSGGQIHLFPPNATSQQYCMDAGTSPATGTAVVLQPCSAATPPIAQQVWAYRSDLSIELVESVAQGSTALCIDTGSAPTQHSVGDPLVLEPCAVSDKSVCAAGVAKGTNGCGVSPWNQQWSIDDNAHLEGAKTDQSDLDGTCIYGASQSAGIALSLASCAGGTQDQTQTWVLSSSTGTGMASAGDNQLVNYRQFATCLDVTGQQVSATYLILYNCKQNPNPANVRWNQKFVPSVALGTAPTKTLLQVTPDGGPTYCLQSPGTSGGYPTLSTPCPSSVSTAGAGFVWTVSQKYANSAGTVELPYATKYTIKDDTVTSPAGGLCLGPGPSSDTYLTQYLKATVNTCTGGTDQKWNADPSSLGGALTDVHETGTSGG